MLVDRRGDVERQVARADADRHLQHEIAIRAQRLDRELPQVAAERRLRRIDERRGTLRCRCSSSGRRGASAARRDQPRLAPRREVRGLLMVLDRCCTPRRTAGTAARCRSPMPCPTTLGHLVDLEVERPGAIGDDVILVRAVADVNAIGALLEQIDGRRAEQREIRARRRRSRASASPRPNRITSSISSPSTRLSARASPVSSKKRKRCGNAKYSCSSR